MPRKKTDLNQLPKTKRATTVQGRENELISLAVDLAEAQLRNGTASSQVITHFLQLGSTTKKLEKIKLEEETRLLKAKSEALASSKRIEELFSNALIAMRSYGGEAMNGGQASDDVTD